MEKLKLNTRNDPAREYFGPAEDENSERLEDIRRILREHGVGIIVHDEGDESIGYSVGSADYGGQLHATDGMSLSAWEHEFDHFNYDMELGFPGMGFYLLNPEIRADMEKRAYGLEIDRALSGV